MLSKGDDSTGSGDVSGCCVARVLAQAECDCEKRCDATACPGSPLSWWVLPCISEPYVTEGKAPVFMSVVAVVSGGFLNAFVFLMRLVVVAVLLLHFSLALLFIFSKK